MNDEHGDGRIEDMKWKEQRTEEAFYVNTRKKKKKLRKRYEKGIFKDVNLFLQGRSQNTLSNENEWEIKSQAR